MSAEFPALETRILQSPAPRTVCPKIRPPEKYTDSEFPGSLSSLIGPTRPTSYHDEWKDLVWVRPSQLFPQLGGELQPKGRLFSPTSPKNNLLANLSFTSALSILAETPELITRLFQLEWASNTGGYSVWLHTNGCWKCYFIDDLLPAIPGALGNFELAFSGAGDGALTSLWISLLEKAYAKSLGSYAATALGSVAAALTDLTGAVFHTHKIALLEVKELWDLVKQTQKEGRITAFHLRPTPAQLQSAGQEAPNTAGTLSGGTVCRILGFIDDVTSDGKSISLVKIRVSKGKPTLARMWPEVQQVWADNFQNRFGPAADPVENVIWLPIEHCKNVFDELIEGAITVQDYYDSMRMQNPHQSIFVCKQLAPTATKTEITIHQIDIRKSAISGAGTLKYPFVRLTVLEVATFGFRFIESKFGAGREISVSPKLTAGNYIVLVEQYFGSEVSVPSPTVSLISSDKLGARLLPAPVISGLFASTESAPANTRYLLDKFFTELEAWRSYVHSHQQSWIPQLKDEKQNQWSVFLHKDSQAYLQLEAIHNNSDPLKPNSIIYERNYTGKGVQFSENVFNGAAILRPNPQQIDLALIKPNPLFSDNEFVIGGFMPVVVPTVIDPANKGFPASLDNHFSNTFQLWQKVLSDMSSKFDSSAVGSEGACGQSCTLI